MSAEPTDLRERYERLQVLHSISTALSAAHEPREIFALVLREAVRVTRAGSGSLVLINPTTGLIEIEAAIGLSEEAQKTKLPLDQGITDWVARTGEPLRVGDVAADRRYVAVRECVRSEPELRPTDLNALLDDVLLLVRHKLAHQSVSLRQELAPGLPPIALDRTQIEQVILDLILNAAQAMPSGGALTIATRSDAAGVWLIITDTGVGITPEARQRLFDPFLTTKPAGTGIGLALVHKIIEAHKGRIEVESAQGKGTTFRVLLPA